MSREEVVAKVQSQIWQSLAVRGGTPSIPQAELATLIAAIAEGVGTVLDGVPQVPAAPAPPPAPAPVARIPDDEAILWSGKPHVTAGSETLSTHYEVTSQRLRIKTGMLGRKTDEADLIRVKDIRIEQGLTERGLGVGNVIITTTDPSQPTIILRKVSRPEEVKELIRQAVRDEKERRGVSYRDIG